MNFTMGFKLITTIVPLIAEALEDGHISHEEGLKILAAIIAAFGK